MRVEVVHGTRPESLKYLRPYLKRVLTFSQDILESDADPDLLYIDLVANFLSENPQKLMMIVVDDQDKIVAHLLAAIEYYYGYTYLTIMHFWKNHNVSLAEIYKGDAWEFVLRWGQANGAKKVRAFARNKYVARLFKKFGLNETGVTIVQSG